MTRKTMLDTDILSAIMRQDATTIARAADYLSDYAQLSFSIITRFEILRGLKAKRATSGLRTLGAFCKTCNILPLTEDVVVRASDICADLYQRGALIGDADILIAATAIASELTLATNNAAHFARIDKLTIDNWTQ